MSRAYSTSLRERLMAAVESATGAYAAASIIQVSVSHVYKALGSAADDRRPAHVLEDWRILARPKFERLISMR